MASTIQKRAWWADWRCNTERLVAVPFPGVNRTWNLGVADVSVPAWLRFIDLMEKHGYLFREPAGGTYNCRKIGGTDAWSLHAYGIAVDLNPSKNPFHTQTHDYPQGFIDDVLATGLFRWGIEFDDPMHWEIDVPPDQIPDYLEDDMTPDEFRQIIREEAAEAVWAPGKDAEGNYFYLIDGQHPNTILRSIKTRVFAIAATAGAGATQIVNEIANRLAG